MKRTRPRVVIAGGGIAALEAFLVLDDVAGDCVEIVLLSATPHFQYRALTVAEPFGLGRAHRVDLGDLTEGRNVEIVVDALDRVDHRRRELGTASGVTMGYDALLVAVGAHRRNLLPGTLGFFDRSGPAEVRTVLEAARAGHVERLVFAVPAGVSWALPAYELALMAAAHFKEGGTSTEVSLVTGERRPAVAFGERGSAAVQEVLRLRGVTFHSAVALRAEPSRLLISGREPIAADAVIALPGLDPVPIEGLPSDERGYLRTDEQGRVRDTASVYAAGEITDFPVKQGGIAAQQANAAATTIAADLGFDVRPPSFRPSLRGLLLAGRPPRYLRVESMQGTARDPRADAETCRWRPAKVAGRHLAPLLARHGIASGAPPGTMAMELEARLGRQRRL